MDGSTNLNNLNVNVHCKLKVNKKFNKMTACWDQLSCSWFQPPYDPNVSFYDDDTIFYFIVKMYEMWKTKKLYIEIARPKRVNKIKYEIYHVSVVR